MKSFAFIIVAGGKGSRFGEKKQFMKLAGRELWRWSAEKALEICDEVILVIPEEENLERESFTHSGNIKITHGGSERALSVLNGLELAESDYVLVHDAARPFASVKLFRSLMENVSEDKGVIPVLPVADALKRMVRSVQEVDDGCASLGGLRFFVCIVSAGMVGHENKQGVLKPGLLGGFLEELADG